MIKCDLMHHCVLKCLRPQIVTHSWSGLVCHRGFQGGTSAYVAVRKGSIVGNGGVGESPSLLFLVPLTLSGDEEGVRSRAGRARGSTHAGRPPPGGAVRFWLFHPVQDPGGRVWVEREGAVGHVPAWAGRPYPSRDWCGGVTSRFGRTCGFGLTRGRTASATWSSRSTQVNTETFFLRHRRYGRSLVGWRTHAGG